MFNYLKGEVAEVNGSYVVLDVNGVGYELAASVYTISECKVGQQQRLYTYLQVKEDGVGLFGFSTSEEKNMFLMLISVSGVGCKVALSILSGMDSKSLATAIFNEDVKQLSKIKGLGKKTAERLVLELKEKMVPNDAATPLATYPDLSFNKDISDAVAVLCSLGKSQQDAEKLVQAASKLGASTASDLVSMAFKIG